jgi:transposase InsO family protein
MGIECGINRVARIMKQHNIKAVMSTTHKRSHEATNTTGFANNKLNRNFRAQRPNQKWVSDTTFVATKQGWLYLAVIMDLYSRKIIGWSMSKRNNTEFVTEALKMAIKSKSIDEKVLLHSDQGATYRANDYLSLFEKNNITQSMSNKGECHDNAVVESFFSRLKTELIQLKTYQTRDIAKSKIFEYIEIFYNKVRRHSYLNYESPDNFEKQYYNAVSQ